MKYLHAVPITLAEVTFLKISCLIMKITKIDSKTTCNVAKYIRTEDK